MSDDTTFPAKPNFEGVTRYAAAHPPLAAWLDKLAEWCDAAIASDERQGRRISDLEQDAAEMADHKRSFDLLVEDLLDVERGIKTLDEVMRDSDLAAY